LANAFALKTVVNMEPVMRDTFAQLLQRLDDFIKDQEENHTKDALNLRLW
jgi:hypothetical protein